MHTNTGMLLVLKFHGSRKTPTTSTGPRKEQEEDQIRIRVNIVNVRIRNNLSELFVCDKDS